MREHAALIPEHMRGRMLTNEIPPLPSIKRRPGRPRKEVEVSATGLTVPTNKGGEIYSDQIEEIQTGIDSLA